MVIIELGKPIFSLLPCHLPVPGRSKAQETIHPRVKERETVGTLNALRLLWKR